MVFLGLGSNVGDRATYLEQACQELSRIFNIQKVSSIYETEPWGVLNQPPFLNQCIAGTSSLPPYDLLVQIKRIELDLGRSTTYPWGPREIDIDMLLYQQDIVQIRKDEEHEFALQIPHPGLANRRFILIPLHEIDSLLWIPHINKPIYQILMECTDFSKVQVFE